MDSVVARYGRTPKLPMPLKAAKSLSEAKLLQRGESFLLDKDHTISRIPLIRLFGPGRYWQVTLGDCVVVGEGVDGDTPDRELLVLEMRRRGEVYGKWFSQFCVRGELGTRHFRELEVISEAIYLNTILGFRGVRHGERTLSGS